MEKQRILKEQIRMVDQSLFYLILTVLSVLLFIWSALIQREQLEETLAGNPQKTVRPDVFPIKLSASTLAASALAFFFCLALQTCRDASSEKDAAAQKSAEMNVWAGLFALAAGLIHICDLSVMEEVKRSLAAESVDVRAEEAQIK